MTLWFFNGIRDIGRGLYRSTNGAIDSVKSYQVRSISQTAHIVIQNLDFEFDTKTIFDNLDLQLSGQQTLTLVGDNGCGKSSLLKIIAGMIPPNSGVVKTTGIIGYLPQSFEESQSKTCLDQMIHAFGDMALSEHAQTPKNKRNQRWFSEFKHLGGSKLLSSAHELGLTRDHLMMNFHDLSGGEKVKTHLAGLKELQPDILLLDEPTNHLDFAAAAWIDRFIRSHKGLTIMVSHDRALINNTNSQIAEISPFTHRLQYFSGGYSQYLRDQHLTAKRAQKKMQTEHSQIQLLQKKKDRLNYASSQKVKKKIERLKQAQTEEPVFRKTPKILFGNYSVSKINLSLSEISKGILFDGISASLSTNDRLLITGKNGSGKTTLLDIIYGLDRPDRGQVHISPKATIGYFDQEQRNLDLSLSPVQLLKQTSDQFQSETLLIRHLAKFGLIDRHDYHTSLKNLSMGVRRKAHLAQLFASQPDILLLDEPTNHIDLLSTEQIENQLLSFPGIIIAVSHDRVFIEKIATNIVNLDTFKPIFTENNRSSISI